MHVNVLGLQICGIVTLSDITDNSSYLYENVFSDQLGKNLFHGIPSGIGSYRIQ